MAGIKEKVHTANILEEYKKFIYVKKYFKNGVERFHTDCRSEYNTIEVRLHTHTTTDALQHNAFAEPVDRKLIEPVVVLLEEAVRSARYWVYVVEHAAYVKNLLPYTALSCSTFENLTGKKPSLKLLRAFRCAAFVYDETPKSNFHSRANLGIFLACDNYGRYTVELIEDKKIVNSAHVTFDEELFPGL